MGEFFYQIHKTMATTTEKTNLMNLLLSLFQKKQAEEIANRSIGGKPRFTITVDDVTAANEKVMAGKAITHYSDEEEKVKKEKEEEIIVVVNLGEDTVLESIISKEEIENSLTKSLLEYGKSKL